MAADVILQSIITYSTSASPVELRRHSGGTSGDEGDECCAEEHCDWWFEERDLLLMLCFQGRSEKEVKIKLSKEWQDLLVVVELNYLSKGRVVVFVRKS